MAVIVMKTFAGHAAIRQGHAPLPMYPVCIRPPCGGIVPDRNKQSEINGTYIGLLQSTDKEKDYSFIGALSYKNMEGACLYCNHCQPCPQQIEIGTVNKYLDLGKSGDTLVTSHYMKLGHHVEDCIACGVCEQRCPFHVNVIERMQEAKTFF